MCSGYCAHFSVQVSCLKCVLIYFCVNLYETFETEYKIFDLQDSFLTIQSYPEMHSYEINGLYITRSTRSMYVRYITLFNFAIKVRSYKYYLML